MNLPTQNDMATTGVADPWTTFGYSEWQEDALSVRRRWMEMMRLPQEEIEEHCRTGTYADLDEELEEYNAIFRVQEMNEASRNRD